MSHFRKMVVVEAPAESMPLQGSGHATSPPGPDLDPAHGMIWVPFAVTQGPEGRSHVWWREEPELQSEGDRRHFRENGPDSDV